MEITIQQLEELYAYRDLLAMDKSAKRAQVIPSEVAAELDAIESEYEEKEAILKKRVEESEAFLKSEAVAAGKKITGQVFYVQFRKSSPTVKVDDVLRVADRFEKVNPEFSAELRSIITMTKPSASIKPVGT